jgi:D-alanine transfer protein
VTVRVNANAGVPHLASALMACGLVAAILFAARTIAICVEQSTISSTAPKAFSLKNQGLAFQRAAVRAPDVLPLYGSSELLVPQIPERAGNFFCTAPTGFQVSPVGKAGTTSMIILQKIGAIGSDLRGKKLAILLSPVWFWGVIDPHWYEGNFSLRAASEMTFGSTLDFQLKRDIASRMLQFPRTMAKSLLLEFALRGLASGKRVDQIFFCLLWPLGKIQSAVLDLQDHFAALSYILHDIKPAPRRHAEMIEWSKLIAQVERKTTDQEKNEQKALDPDEQIARGRRDAWFREHVNEAREWGDFELLLRTLAKIHAQPLLISMPLDGRYYDRSGVSRAAREAYYKKLRAFAQQYNVALVEFEEHDEDPTFLDRRTQMAPVPGLHLTAKGWMFYNRALDEFFHGRVPQT